VTEELPVAKIQRVRLLETRVWFPSQESRTSLKAAQCLQRILLEFSGGKTPPLARYAVDYFAIETFFSNPVIAPVKKQLAHNLPLYELKITLRGSKPAIWRRVQIPGSINLNRLHDVFQVVQANGMD
jgi:hypothetical protein